MASATDKVPGGGVSVPTGGVSGVLPVGTYIVAALAAVALSNTAAGPLVVGFLAAAVLFQAGQIFRPNAKGQLTA